MSKCGEYEAKRKRTEIFPAEYADELGENMDVFVLGGWWGKGARGGKIASLLFGLRNENEKENEDDQPTCVRVKLCLVNLLKRLNTSASSPSDELAAVCHTRTINGCSKSHLGTTLPSSNTTYRQGQTWPSLYSVRPQQPAGLDQIRTNGS